MLQNFYTFSVLFSSRMADRLRLEWSIKTTRGGRKGKRRWGQSGPRLGHFVFGGKQERDPSNALCAVLAVLWPCMSSYVIWPCIVNRVCCQCLEILRQTGKRRKQPLWTYHQLFYVALILFGTPIETSLCDGKLERETSVTGWDRADDLESDRSNDVKITVATPLYRRIAVSSARTESVIWWLRGGEWWERSKQSDLPPTFVTSRQRKISHKQHKFCWLEILELFWS